VQLTINTVSKDFTKKTEEFFGNHFNQARKITRPGIIDRDKEN